MVIKAKKPTATENKRVRESGILQRASELEAKSEGAKAAKKKAKKKK